MAPKIGKIEKKVNVIDSDGFNSLLEQLDRIINELLMEYALNSFNLFHQKNKEYSEKRAEIEAAIEKETKPDNVLVLEKSIIQLNSDYANYRDFGFEAWTVYSNRSTESFEKNKTIFCKESIYILLNKLLFVRILEDKKIIPPHISDGGIESLRGFIAFQKYKGVFDFAFKNVQSIYRHFYEPGILDWLISGNGELDKQLNRILWILNQYDFSIVNQDILGNLYEKYLSKDERKELGEFYTPVPIIEYILDKVGFMGSDIRGKTIIDPSCGSGGFLICAIKRLIQSYLTFYGKTSISDCSSDQSKEILKGITENIIGWDINPFACHIAEINLHFYLVDLISNIKDEAYKTNRIKIFHTDSLLKPIFIEKEKLDLYKYVNDNPNENVKFYADEQKLISEIKGMKFDFVVGNPPYLSVKNIASEKYSQYKENYPEIAKGRTDLYIMFLKLGYDLLKDGKKLGFIVSDQFLIKKAGNSIKNFLLKNTKILEITDFQQYTQFLDATNYTAIIIFEKCSNKTLISKNKINYNYLISEIPTLFDDLRTDPLIPEINHLDIPQKKLKGNGTWKFENKKGNKIIDRIEKLSLKKLKDLGDGSCQGLITNKCSSQGLITEKDAASNKCSRQGLITGKDDVLIGQIDTIESDVQNYKFIPLGDINEKLLDGYLIEKDVICPVIHGRNVRRYTKIISNKGVLFYYKTKTIEKNTENGSIKKQVYCIIPLTQIQTDYPKCFDYLNLTKVRSVLADRNLSRVKKCGDYPDWHRLIREREPKIYRPGTILTRGINNFPNFTLNKMGVKYVGGGAGVYGIMLDDLRLVNEFKITKNYLLGLLNSSTYSYYYRNKGAVKRGGHYQVSGYIFDDTPIFLPNSEKEQELIGLIDQKVQSRLLLEDQTDNSEKIIKSWNEFNLGSIINCTLLSKFIEPKITESDDLKVKIDKNELQFTGGGLIQCKSEIIAKAIFNYLVFGIKWESSGTPLEDLRLLKLPLNESNYQTFLSSTEKLIYSEKSMDEQKKQIEIEINVLVLKLFKFTETEVSEINSKYVDPWK